MQVQIRRILQMWIVGAVATMSLICGAGATNLDVTVPASLPITVSSNGTITTATNAKIQNNCTSPIKISSIKVTAQNGWSLATKSEASNADSNEKKIAMSFNGAWMNTNGSVDVSSFGNISSKSSGTLSYSAAIPMATAASTETAATSTIVVSIDYPTMAARSGWYKSSIDPEYITKITFEDSYTPTTSVDETWNADVGNAGRIRCYRIGTEIIIAGDGTGKIMANEDSSYMFTSEHIFYSEEGQFGYLDSIENLYLLDTSNAKTFYRMFYTCGIYTLDLSGFNTTNVQNTSEMFYNCYCLGTIYVSDKWVLTKDYNSTNMFSGCSTLKGDIAFDSNYIDKTYAKTSGGYLTYKGATAKTLSLNIDPDNGTVDSYSIFSVPAKKNDGSD